MSTHRKLVQLGRDLIGVTVWDDESATLCVADGATVGTVELAQVLEAFATYLRTGEMGKLPPDARLVGVNR